MIANAAWRRREACARDNQRITYNANREEVDTLLESSAIPLGVAGPLAPTSARASSTQNPLVSYRTLPETPKSHF